ncbi:Procollagen-lysine,2-oxoglutarate 5-dioxygenase 1 [Tyrophagus putrescentiae]|nr:Procollagen-lysine,2-oxoglutarate 5-dioxygenase 1 [Tyrophagus putrescentiae]
MMKMMPQRAAILIGSVLFLLLSASQSVAEEKATDKLVVVTVATHITDGFQRFNRSVHLYGLKLEVLGLHQEWKGGDIARLPGGGQKIRLLKKYLESVSTQSDLVVLFTDSYDVIMSAPGGPEEILARFRAFEPARVVFSSEKYCWPDPKLASEYPKSDGKRYLNSGAFIGYAPDLHAIVSERPVENTDDDQLYYTKVYLNADLRSKHSIRLDLLSELFQNLNGAIDDIDESTADAFLFNRATNSQPLVVHGNGNSKVPLNSLGNYLAKSWHPATGCLTCEQEEKDKIEPQKSQNLVEGGEGEEVVEIASSYPHVLIAVNVLKPTPFFAEFLEDITLLDYPKGRITLFIQSLVELHSGEVEQFIDDYKSYYRSIRYITNEKEVEWQLRNRYLDEVVRVGADYLFVWDSEARITNARTLQILMQYNRTVVAPLLTRPNELWSNFWGALTHDGFYARSTDYIQIVKNERRGLWNVPHISSAYLVNASLFDENSANRAYNFRPLSYHDPNAPEKPAKNTDKESAAPEVDPDMHFCRLLRENGVFMYVSNLPENFGHLARLETYDLSRRHPDFYEIYSNEIDWRRRYIHPNYSAALLNESIIEQPCPDVYWFPVGSPAFCQHLIEIMEHFGQWSGGKNYDPRLEGGYENVPTRDIHMNQVGLDQHTFDPMQEKLFTGYVHDPPRATMNFVVRYHPNEQANLRPHHDSSTYTINIALNRPKIDYQGGGCRFLRYNCSLTNLRLGWSLIHPGRLTHYHEGLTVTSGVRYIMVSFVDP